MKGFAPLILGLLATLAFSWLGLAYIPDLQIGHLEPQSDEEGTDIYPMPRSGMAERGRRVYVANGCFYCHSQQIRADYAASDVDLQRWAAPPAPSPGASPAPANASPAPANASPPAAKPPAQPSPSPAAGTSPAQPAASSSPAVSSSESPAPYSAAW